MLVLGVEDDRRVVGVADADATMRLVDTVSYQNVEPPLLCLQETVMIGDSTVLVVRVPKGPERPYRTNRGVYYVRTSSGRRQATREELMRLYHTALAIFPDELPVRGTGVRHLNVGYFEEFFRRHYGLAEEQITGVQSLPGPPPPDRRQHPRVPAGGQARDPRGGAAGSGRKCGGPPGLFLARAG